MNSKVFVLFITVFLWSFKLQGQTFEGKIVYRNTFISKLQGVSNEKLASLIGTKQEFFIKDGKYKSITNGQIEVQLYDDELNRIYNKTSKSDTLYWFDASINSDNVMNFNTLKGADTILGKVCDALFIKTKTGQTILYFSKEYKLAASKYLNHKFSNWAFFTEKSEALPLKIIIESAQFRMESIAVEIVPIKINRLFFSVDKNVPLKKS